jgi:hypothetical protein
MRWIAFIALAVILPGSWAAAQSAPQKSSQLPTPSAEPANPEAYGPVAPLELEGPSAADVGPVQKHFVLVSEPDHAESVENNDNAAHALAKQEKTALDKRITVPKIHDVQDDGSYQGTHNPALDYEIRYINWGAVTERQLRARYGHYFTITWANHGPRADFTARFEYTQVKSKEIIRTLTQPMPQVAGTTRSYFAVVSKAYLAYGPVSSWRFTILKGDTVVAEAKSFIW